MKTSYNVRRSRGTTWAVDEILHLGPNHQHHIKQKTRYFPTKKEARDFKKRKVKEE